jgi:hypothetical protein
MPLDEDMVRRMIGGLTGIRDSDVSLSPDRPTPVYEHPGPSTRAIPALQRGAVTPRPPRNPLPGEVLRFTADEAIKMSAVAPLIRDDTAHSQALRQHLPPDQGSRSGPGGL